MIRLGGPVFGHYDDPEAWAQGVTQAGYRAAYCPVSLQDDAATVRAWEQAAQAADIVIAEVGAWSNPLSPDEAVACAALDLCRRALALADEIGARCCVNISGSRTANTGSGWHGPDPRDLTGETFERIVEQVRSIIDAVQPRRSCYALETMPWSYPDSPESYARLLKAIDRPAFGVHLDPVNLVSSPQRYFGNGDLIRECFRLLGPHIKSCHAKDILLHETLTVHLDEVRPGLGHLDYATYLGCLHQLDQEVPLMLEHLPDEAEYTLAAKHIRDVAQLSGVPV